MLANYPDPPERGYISLEEVRQRGEIIAGIYFIFSDGHVAYVGKSVNIFQRLRSHDRVRPNDRFSFICFADADDRFYAELFYVGALRPPRNGSLSKRNIESSLRSVEPRESKPPKPEHYEPRAEELFDAAHTLADVLSDIPVRLHLEDPCRFWRPLP